MQIRAYNLDVNINSKVLILLNLQANGNIILVIDFGPKNYRSMYIKSTNPSSRNAVGAVCCYSGIERCSLVHLSDDSQGLVVNIIH